MSSEFIILLITSISVALIHTITGPDHYLPFIVIAKARGWSLKRTAWFTVLCGIGHVGSSILLGLLGIFFGIAISKLTMIEGIRGSLISWLFTAFGLVYLVWGIYKLLRNKSHSHLHFHKDGLPHHHHHHHHKEHLHIHEDQSSVNITPWILFTIFLFGPCEPLIPIVMYPAAKHNAGELALVTLAFSVMTIATMVTIVMIASYGVRLFPMKLLEKYSHTLAGATIFLCGLGMIFLGL